MGLPEIVQEVVRVEPEYLLKQDFKLRPVGNPEAVMVMLCEVPESESYAAMVAEYWMLAMPVGRMPVLMMGAWLATGGWGVGDGVGRGVGAEVGMGTGEGAMGGGVADVSWFKERGEVDCFCLMVMRRAIDKMRRPTRTTRNLTDVCLGADLRFLGIKNLFCFFV